MAAQLDKSRPTRSALETQLGFDLWALIDSIGVPVVEAIPVTTIQSTDSRRASFRVTFADGRVVKGRRVRSTMDVERITRLSSLLDPRYFPHVLAHRGCALLTPWIPGRRPRPNGWTSDLLRTCARLQAAIHGLPIPAEMVSLRRRPIAWEQRLDKLLSELVACEALVDRHAREVYRLAVLHAPATTSEGLCHTDFCGDNVIITDVGEVCVIDNEGITVDSYEYDLARTWYRWPMTPSQQHAYAEGYDAHDHAGRFATHFFHWALMAVVDSAAYRIRLNAASARIPLRRLATLLRTHGEGELFPRLLSRR